MSVEAVFMVFGVMGGVILTLTIEIIIVLSILDKTTNLIFKKGE